MAKKKFTTEQEKEIKYLQSSNDMLEKTKEEAKIHGTENAVKRIEIAQQDIYEQLNQIDPSLVKQFKKKNTENIEINPTEIYADNDTIFQVLDKINNDVNIDDVIIDNKENVKQIDTADNKQKTIEKKPRKYKKNIDEEEAKQNIEKDISVDMNFNNVDAEAQYDIISLPSNGECYANKIKRLPVGYLTAYDENFITSPNLYKDGLIIDFLLKNKILNKNIDIEQLCIGDVDAIMLFLRITSYGPEFPIIVTDPDSGEKIETVIDLSTIKYKKFNLVGDENGFFDFQLPLSKDNIKFKFLTRKEEKQLILLNNYETNKIKSNNILSDINNLHEAIKTDKTMDIKQKQIFIKNLQPINEWALKLKDEKSNNFTKMITNKLEMSIVSINGNNDKEFISKYVRQMNARDSLNLRRYMIENEPGVNFEIEIQRPESLGGGSFKTFLNWDDSIFLNIK